MNHWDAAMSKLNTKSELSFLSQLGNDRTS